MSALEQLKARLESSRDYEALALLKQAETEHAALAEEAQRLRAAAHIGIELDNHHNALFCPYCNLGGRELTDERDRLRATVGRVREAVATFCHGEQVYAEHAHYCVPILTALDGSGS